MKVCKVEGCDSTKRGARGFCGKHYTRWKRHGDVDTVLPGRATPRASTCEVDGCDRRGNHRGMCSPHRHRMVEFGDPLAWVPIGDRAGLAEVRGPEPVEVDACVDCGAEPYCDGAWRCEPCMLADLRRRSARRPSGQSSATPDPSRTAVRQARMPTFARRGTA